MKRGGPLKTYSSLKPGKALTRKTPMNRTRMSKTVKAKRRKERQLSRDIANVQSAYWEKKAKDAWVIAVPILSGFKCLMCDKTERLHRAHLYPKERRFTRWHPMNAVLLCVDHHLYNTTLSEHQGSPGFYAELARRRPEQFKWIGIIRPQIDDAVALKNWNYREQYELSRAIIDEQHDYEWLCRRLGLAPAE